MSYIGAPLVSTNHVLDQFTATSGQTAFTLSRAPASAQSIIVMIDGAIQEPGQAYTVSGVTLTTTAGVGLNNRVAVIHLGVAGVLTTPADGSVTYAKLATDARMPQMFSGSATAATSGTSIDFTGIPTGTKMIVVGFNGVSNSGTDPYIVQLGDAGGIEVSGYTSVGINAASGSAGATAGSSAGFTFASPGTAASTYFGHVILTLLDTATFLWAFSSNVGDANQTRYHTFAGSKSTSQELDRIRVTTTTGTPTFDAGSLNVSYFR